MTFNPDHLLQIDEESLRQAHSRDAMEKLLADMARGHYARAVLSANAVRQEVEEINAAPLVTNEGNMRPRCVIAGEDFHYWGQRLGYSCWDDPTFLREYERDNPDCRVNAKMANASVLNQWGQPAAA